MKSEAKITIKDIGEVLSDEAEVIRVRRLASNGVWLIEDVAGLFEQDLGEDWEAAKVGASYVETTRRVLSAVAEELEQRLDDFGESAGLGAAETPEQADFAEANARRSVLITIKRIEYALAGQRQPGKVHVSRSRVHDFEHGLR